LVSGISELTRAIGKFEVPKARSLEFCETLGTLVTPNFRHFFSMEVIVNWNVKIYGRRGELNTSRA